jgi:aspartate aminotransferase-like enzyme
MGNVNCNDIIATVSAIERSLKKFGHTFEFGVGCKAAMETLESSS